MSRIVNLATLEELKELTAVQDEKPEKQADILDDEPVVSAEDPDRQRKVLVSLQNQCAKREYCSTDIMKKAVKTLGGDRKLAAEIVASLISERFVDDLRYASAFAREKSSITGWGPSKIRYALTMKGIPRQTIDQALPEIDPDSARARMAKVLAAKWKVLREEPYGKFKLIKYGLSRGYDYDEISACVNEMTSDKSDE